MNELPVTIRYNLWKKGNTVSLRAFVEAQTYLIVVGDKRADDVYVHGDTGVVFFAPSSVGTELERFVQRERDTLNAITHLVNQNADQTEIDKVWNALKVRYPVTRA